MSNKPYRLAQGGSRIDRTKKVHFSFDGKQLDGFAGDTLASAVMANGTKLFGRSFKYHRPRGRGRSRLGGNERARRRGRRLAP